jgi:RimJ/RimL family protein N-acetyltransferase
VLGGGRQPTSAPPWIAFAQKSGNESNNKVPRPAKPPERIDAGVVILRRNRTADAAAVAKAVRQSLDHLQPWMPWAQPGAASVQAQAARLAEVEAGWRRGTDFVYLLVPEDGAGDEADLAGAEGTATVAEDAVLGMIGLHRRLGPGAIEIGYWTHVAHAGRGYMTAAAKAITQVAEALDDVHRVEIHTDEANARSAAIPPKLGYRLDRVDTRRPEAPAESGRLQIWVRP